MAILSGTRLGSYEVRSAIGAGGMGEVYQCRDTKLGRDVAIKVLPDAFAADSDRLARFQREAKMLAALNHPNIAAIYGLEEDGKRNFLVMELVPGETLQERISRDGAVPLEEALGIARQIAEALEAAHEKGIIHRDLKPANVKITPEGKIKVLDFGLAKAYESGTEGLEIANSPTLSQAATMQGIILGTAAYMSPEQARGKNVDKRTDIWAFGVVLCELLTGERLFTGEDVTETLASVVKDQPDLNRVPVKARRLLERCLQKNPKKRLRDIGDAELLLEVPPEEASNAASSPPWMSAKVAWSAAGLFLVAAGMLGLLQLRQKPPASAASVRFELTPPDNGTVSSLAMSPDGSKLAMVVQGPDGQPAAWIRSLDSVDARKLTGTEGATALAWSPDNRYLAFNSGGKIKKTDVTGGAPEIICSYMPPLNGIAWNNLDVIVFGTPTGLSRVSASGGDVVPLTQLNAKREDLGQGGPVFLPDQQHFVYLIAGNTGQTGLYLGSTEEKPAQQDSQRLTESDSTPQYAPADGNGLGSLLFLRGDTLMARPFDAKRRQFTGAAVRAADSVGTNGGYLGLFSVSGNGILATSSGGSGNRQLVWYDRQGKVLSSAGEPARRDEISLSPDGTRVAEGRVDAQGSWGVWVMELARGTSSRFTFESTGAGNGIWSPDGSQIAYAAGGGQSTDIYRRPSNGATKEEILFHSDSLKTPLDWSSDGRWLLYTERGKDTGFDLWALPDPSGPAAQERKPVPYLVTPFNEVQAKFSPDGKWVAYSSNETGTVELYVRPFPASSTGKWLVSNGGGRQVRWRPDGKELFYVAPGGALMAAEVHTTTSTFEVGVPKVLFRPQILGGLGGGPSIARRFDVSKDGQRFLINTAGDDKSSTPITVTTQWTELLKK
jgi:serine/threonine protein kinase/dipeptidyl aminopeptidase/acylaminoacyl peptidase